MPTPVTAARAREPWQELVARGLLTRLVPPPAGGGDTVAPEELVGTVEALVEAGRAGVDQGLLFAAGAHGWAVARSIARFGTPEQQERWLPGLADGTLVGAFATTEPDAGSDVLALRTTARATAPGSGGWTGDRTGDRTSDRSSDQACGRGDGPAAGQTGDPVDAKDGGAGGGRTGDRDGDLIVDGEKVFVTNAPIADLALVLTTDDPGRGWAVLSMVVVDRTTAGTTWSPPWRTIGLPGATLGGIAFAGARVPATDRLGPAGTGLAVFQHALTWERGFILAPVAGRLRWWADRARAGGDLAHVGRLARQRAARWHERAELARWHVLGHAAARADAGASAGGRARRRLEARAALVKLALSEAWVATATEADRLDGPAGTGGTDVLPMVPRIVGSTGACVAFGAGGPGEAHELPPPGRDRTAGDRTDRERIVGGELADALAARLYSGTSQIQRDLIGLGLGLP